MNCLDVNEIRKLSFKRKLNRYFVFQVYVLRTLERIWQEIIKTKKINKSMKT